MNTQDITPTALIVGAQNAGAIALRRNLAKHPKVLGIDRQIGFFSSKWERGPDWYLSQLKSACPKDQLATNPSVTIEESPSYLTAPEACARIQSFNPSMKIIACLSNPVDRAFSRYNDIRSQEPGRIKSSFFATAKAGIAKENHFLRAGKYAAQLALYLDAFGPNNVRIIVQEQWVKDPWDTLKNVFGFLGIAAETEFEVALPPRTKGKPMPKGARTALNAYFKPHNEALFELLGYEIPEWADA
ncbi:MAG: hypothetical protein ACJASV_001883 [Pseudorhodobacter sp.]|jgi:hypothetical protein